MRNWAIALLIGLFLALSGNAKAILIDPYDNVLAPDGFYGLAYYNYYTADEFTDKDGDKAADIDLTAQVTILRGVMYKHVSDIPFAFNVIVPFGELSEDDLLDESSSGLGDVIFGPGVFMMADEKSGTYLSYWLFIYSPTGAWDEDQTINLGQNHWYFQNQLAFNKMYNGFVYDMNLNLYIHTEESDHDYQAPMRFEVEASLAYQVTDKFIFGINGGGYWDLADAEVDGEKIDDSAMSRIQLGTTMGYQFTEKLGGNFRWTHDMDAVNDTKGDDFWVRLSYAF